MYYLLKWVNYRLNEKNRNFVSPEKVGTMVILRVRFALLQTYDFTTWPSPRQKARKIHVI